MAREKMYKRKIRLLGLDKSQEKHELSEILPREAERATGVKRSTFLLRGRVVDIDDIRRYVRRKKISFHEPDELQAHGTAMCAKMDSRAIDLICRTPNPSPLASDPGSISDRTERSYLIFNQYLHGSVEVGARTPSDDPESLGDSLSTGEMWTNILETINLRAARFNDGDYQQAIWQWGLAFTQLEVVVCSRNYYQLLNLISRIGPLTNCDAVVARMLLRHLGKLVSALSIT
ncbi:uncharacterized protein Z519_07711 [Cladophialophora bantiana CBS 173.52]|uniref:Clr5 domain-containing protein n=1 Tax=Cladophialophora bantiana (strain ATCC 10958 / CBS 173.52 / CDC B-1940 / NIH 8579) TaxID=1442370 RepID=A0A0D2HEM9_CLAB1|nr:uncharacterized protein Z519_07711 [Cladophialophora bantiana CBS 173.52]KIW91743.1 hypothetical protein Z519_07711 [Cladophialophora bantiana CBS 173.52]